MPKQKHWIKTKTGHQQQKIANFKRHNKSDLILTGKTDIFSQPLSDFMGIKNIFFVGAVLTYSINFIIAL